MVTMRPFFIAALALGLACKAAASPVELPQFDDDVKKELSELQQSTQQQVDFVLNSGDMSWAKDLEKQAQDVVAKSAAGAKKEPPHPLGEGMRKLVFVSWSMGDHEIKELLLEYNGDANVGLLFRGIPDEMKMVDALAKMQRLSQQTKSSVSVLLDPVAFQKHGITVVPSVVIENGDELLAKAKGTSSIARIEDALKEGKKGDLGYLGPTLEIAERDLIEQMKEKFASLDPEEMKRKALARFWKGQTMFDLPHAEETRTRRLDPSVTVQQDMVTPDGKVIYRAGDVINPLSIRPFTQRLLIIDPAVLEQVSLAREQMAAFGKSQTVTLILSSVDVEGGWDDLQRIQGAVSAPAYMLKADVKERFAIERTPSIVTADGQSFFIEERYVGRGQVNDQASNTVDP
ncbi:TPA: TrbC family F-type conjugative pilus assembly protein [Pseudomonas aeruginosa]